MQDLKQKTLTEHEIREFDNKYCSWGDTTHYSKNPKIFSNCEGTFMFDNNDTPYLDLQMWYASCNLGYKNPKISNAVIDCINSMPQIASRFLFENKVLLASKIARANEKRFNIKGRVHFNVGGAQAVEDALKLEIGRAHV